MKIIVRGSIWVLAIGGALLSPVVLIFIVPLAIGVGADLVQAWGEPVAFVLIASAAAWALMMRRSPRKSSS
jgi:hypothetical protein